MYDRAMQTLHSLVLGPIESATDDKTSFGFKPYRSTKDAYAYLHICLSKKIAPEWIVEGDIKACFDEINHTWILDNIPMDRRILKEFLKAGYVENYHLFPTRKRHTARRAYISNNWKYGLKRLRKRLSDEILLQIRWNN
jgi:RNA-directed DNA polymerase